MLNHIKQLTLKQGVVAAVFILLVFWVLLYSLFFRTPSGFAPETVISVSAGESLGDVSNQLNQNRIISSAFWLKFIIYLSGGQRKIIAGVLYAHFRPTRRRPHLRNRRAKARPF